MDIFEVNINIVQYLNKGKKKNVNFCWLLFDLRKY